MIKFPKIVDHIKNLRFQRNPYLLGVDIGTSVLKIAGFRVKDRPSLLFYAIIDLPKGHGEKEVTEAIGATLKAHNFTAKETALTFTDESFTIRRLELPRMARNDILDALRWQIKDMIRFDAEKAYFDYEILNEFQKEDGSKFMELLVAVVSKEVIDKKVKILKDAGLSVVSISASPFNLEYMIKTSDDIDASGIIAAIDVGSGRSEISFFRNKTLEFVRSIPIGSMDISEALTGKISAESGDIALSAEEAEEFKKQFGILYDEIPLEKGLTTRQVLILIRPVLERLSKEIRRSIDYYTQEYGSDAIAAAYLAGGGCRLKNLDRFLAEELSIPVKPFNLSKTVDVQKTLLKPEDSLSIVSVVGAAAGCGKTPNLLPQEYRLEKVELVEKVSLRMVTIAMGGLLLILYLFLNMRIADYKERLKNANAQASMLNQVRTLQQRAAEMGTFLTQVHYGELPTEYIMRELSTIIPQNVRLDVLELNPRSRTLDMRGVIYEPKGVAEEVLTKFMEALEKSLYLREAQLVSLQGESSAKEDVFHFDINCVLE
jgi:type IV pilus assembly protein PilM